MKKLLGIVVLGLLCHGCVVRINLTSDSSCC